MMQDKQLELARWAEEVQLLPEGYEPITGLVSRSTFAVAVGENPNARPGERYAVAAGTYGDAPREGPATPQGTVHLRVSKEEYRRA